MSEAPGHTGGLYPRTYRRRLRDAPDESFVEKAEFDSGTVSYRGASPFIGLAMHWTNRVSDALAPHMALSSDERRTEEDPFTEQFLGRLTHTVTPNQSRFEFDLNRPADTTVYTSPELAWGMTTWKEPLSAAQREACLEKWYEYHTMVDCAVEHALDTFGWAVVFDFHSYNYQRDGPVDWREDPKPDFNMGTLHLKPDERGRAIIDTFLDSVRGHTMLGDPLKVEENGVFYGGYLNRRLSHFFGPKVTVLSVEYKKIFMDERSGAVNEKALEDLVRQMDDTIVELGRKFEAPVADERALPFV